MRPSTNLTVDNINSIDPSYVYTYLENSGWQEEQKIDERAIIFTIYKNNKKYSLLLPLDQEIPDFNSRMYDLFRVLEFIENRTKDEILKCFENPHQIALQQQTEILSLRFQFIYDKYQKRLSAKKMGVVLVSLQDLFDAFGELEAGKEVISAKGRISKEILEKTEMSVLETFKGSFGVKLAFSKLNQQLSLLERPLAERVSQKFIELINLSNNLDKENLKHMLLQLKKRTASRYRKFLAELIRAESNFYIDWGSVNPESGGRGYLSYENTVHTIEFINKMETENPEQITVCGELLLACKSKRNYLEISSIEDGTEYKGDISDSVLRNTNIELTIGHLYRVVFEELTSINPATGEEKIERNVINIEYIGSTTN